MSAIAWDGMQVFAAPARRQARADGHALRLTRRGRVVVSALALLLALVAALSAQPAGADAPSAPVAVRTHVVAAGETMWEIASGIAEPGSDVRDVVDDLVELNGLNGSGLQAGQQILVPVG